jgi:5-methyltetrahydropteroyltriglutamate--homocysteine methyltransferase
VERYPIFMKESYEASLKKESVDDIRGLPKAVGDIGYPDASEVKTECSDFRAALDATGNPFVEPFLTAPSPGMVSAIVLNEHYKTEEEFLSALGSALRVEYKAIVDAGFLLQLDCPDLAREQHNTYADRPLADFIAFGNRVIDAINAAIHDIPPEKVRLHVCWGNYEGPHDLDVELDKIIPFLKRAKVGGFVLPFANPRHAHEYRYLKDLIGMDQIIVAGVIDSTTNFVEHPEVIAERLENVAETIGDPHRVMAGSDCGFETIAGRGRVAEDVVWAKFKSMAEGAKLASSRLF